MILLDGIRGKGGLRAAFFFLFLAVALLASGEYFQYVLGFLRVAVFLAAAVWLGRGRNPLRVPVYAFAVVAFCALSLGHAFSSVYVWVSLQHALNILLATALLGWAVLLFREGEDRPARKWLLPVLGAVAAVEMAIATTQRLTIGTSRPHGTFSSPMFLSEFLAAAALVFASLTLAEWKDGGRKRVIHGAAAILFLGGALSLTGSRGVVVATVPALAVLVVLHYGFSRGMRAFLLVGVPAVALLGWHSASRFFTADIYNYGRIVFWRSALRIFSSEPFGVGLGGYKYHWYATQDPFPQAFRRFAKYAVTPHNEYLEVLTGLGFPGFVLFCAVLFLPLRYAARGWSGVAGDRRGLAAGALAVMVLTGTNAIFNFNFHEFGNVFVDALLLGALLACLPERSLGRPVTVPPRILKGAAVCCGVLAVGSASLLAGAVAAGRGEALVRAKEYAAAEKAFRIASIADPFRATLPDALSALSYRKFVEADRAKDPSAGDHLLSSVRWLAKARDLCPMEQGHSFRLATLFLEKYRRGGDRRDLEIVLGLTGDILRINPYGAEGYMNRALALQELGDTREAIDTLRKAVVVEPNFCRGYAKLAELTRGTDEPRSRAYEARAAECRKAAEGRVLEESERWLVEEPGNRTRQQGIPTGLQAPVSSSVSSPSP